MRRLCLRAVPSGQRSTFKIAVSPPSRTEFPKNSFPQQLYNMKFFMYATTIPTTSPSTTPATPSAEVSPPAQSDPKTTTAPPVDHRPATDLGINDDEDDEKEDEFQGSMAEFTDLIGSMDKVCVQFCAEWCVPCTNMSPFVKQMKDKYRSEKTRFVYVDVDECPKVTAHYQVTKIPCFLFCRKGKEVSRLEEDVAAKLEAELEKFTKQ
eukprot:PhF_6_TR9088/c0_g1_i1/m.14159